MSEQFVDRLDRCQIRADSLLSVGLDPDPSRLPRALARLPPKQRLRSFIEGVVAHTREVAAVYKAQLAAYLAFGSPGVELLFDLPKIVGPDRLTILDLKANDIPNTMRLYREGLLRPGRFDAITATPWAGWDSIETLLADPGRGVFVVVHTSNAGSRDLQELRGTRGRPIWLDVACRAARLGRPRGNVGVVVGATYPRAIARVRASVGASVPILAPGIGAQAGDLEATVRAGINRSGRGLLVNASRSVLYARGSGDWTARVGRAAAALCGAINAAREAALRTGRRAAG